MRVRPLVFSLAAAVRQTLADRATDLGAIIRRPASPRAVTTHSRDKNVTISFVDRHVPRYSQWAHTDRRRRRSSNTGVVTESDERPAREVTRLTQAHRRGFTRRSFMVLGAGGVGGALASTVFAAPAMAAGPAPTLPGEYWRREGLVTPAGTVYDNIAVRIAGDPAKLHIPRSVTVGSSTPVAIGWLYHGANSDHNAIDYGFSAHSAAIVDSGAVAICQNAGGTMYSHPVAQEIQVAGGEYVDQVFTVWANLLRATSAGGALAAETIAAGLISKVVGLYTVNGSFDLSDMYASGGPWADSVAAVFGNSPGAIEAANPARHGSSAWAGKRARVVVAQPNETDTIVPPAEHGLKLLSIASPTAREATIRAHSNGHSTPGFAASDFVDTALRWAQNARDSTAPQIGMLSPGAGAAVAGPIELRAAAGDNTHVAHVRFEIAGTQLVGALDRASILVPEASGALAWVASLDTTSLPEGPTTVTATAIDPSGNSARSSAVQLTIANSANGDTTAPTVAILTPTNGSTVSGVARVEVSATDDVGVTDVVLKLSSGRVIARPTRSGDLWVLTFDTRSRLSPNGTYSVVAEATDAAGNTGTSAPIRVTIAN